MSNPKRCLKIFISCFEESRFKSKLYLCAEEICFVSSGSPHNVPNGFQPRLKAAGLMQQIQGGWEHQNVHASQIRAKFKRIIVQRRLLQTYSTFMCYLCVTFRLIMKRNIFRPDLISWFVGLV